ncbi:hypothetical protein HQQ82_01215 [Rathayibacter sp. VKM Ac-2856]|uniref:hypothetical protein n=1 Tax=unclassified Rathayibacter TaxID=2609250 RepID=UPI001565B2EF|nr:MULTISPECIES: hypothetical protein [unclassified Rathayibacter]NQX03415.1 hypothetical protein [Rathayibacter sp. VKM Ac-2858]NQX18583.1 hypothetical protein [Rathayibacter sp. VKM Ac-2856]
MPGTNRLEVRVTNAWMNRLIEEAGHPSGQLFAPAAGVYRADAPVRPSGIAGPVALHCASSG